MPPVRQQPPKPFDISAPELPEFGAKDHSAIKMPEIPMLPEPPAKPVVPAKKEPVAKSKVPVKSITFGEFKQEHGEPQPHIYSRQPIQRNVEIPDLSVPHFNNHQHNPNLPRRTALSEALDAAYKAKLKSNANLAWNRPEITNARLLEAKILYRIAPNGTIEWVQFEERSGNAILDHSAIAAARKTRSPGPTPSGKHETIRIRFVIK